MKFLGQKKVLRVTLVMGYEISSLIAGVHIKIFHPAPVHALREEDAQ